MTKTLFDDAPLPKTSIEQTPIIMIDKAGYPTKKPSSCWKWSRLQLGFGWHDGPPAAFMLKDKDQSCIHAK